MIFRVSTKLAKKIKVSPPSSLPADPNPFADWSARLFTADRAQYILVTNTHSLYSMVLHGKGITDDDKFIDRVTHTMSEFMRDDGHEFMYRRFIDPEMARFSFSKALNRSVTGSMNDLAFHARMHLMEDMLSPCDVSFRLNKIPMSSLDYDPPRKAFRSLQVQ